MIVRGRDVVAVPMVYFDEFRRDPVDSLLKYGSLPQRSRAPWFTDTAAITKSLRLPDLVVGSKATRASTTHDSMSLVGYAPQHDPTALLDGISEHFYAHDNSYWHVHVDLALNKKRHGDAAGLAMGRIGKSYVEKGKDPLQQPFERIVRTYEVPLVTQVVAPTGDQIYIGAFVHFILQLKQIRGFNITSFSFDGFQSADAMQQLMLAGLVTAGMTVDPLTGAVTGLPKPFSVDGRAVQPYRELLEGCNEERIALPKYELLRKELRELEVVDPGAAPDHPVGGSKDVADPVAGVIGYLAAFGHAELQGAPTVIDRGDLEREFDLPPSESFTVEGDETFQWEDDLSPVSFEVS